MDTKRPSVYAYWQRAWIEGQPHLQLTYVHRFPEHPRQGARKGDQCGCSGKLRLGADVEAGQIDGGTLRITLDANWQPAVFETEEVASGYFRG